MDGLLHNYTTLSELVMKKNKTNIRDFDSESLFLITQDVKPGVFHDIIKKWEGLVYATHKEDSESILRMTCQISTYHKIAESSTSSTGFKTMDRFSIKVICNKTLAMSILYFNSSLAGGPKSEETRKSALFLNESSTLI